MKLHLNQGERAWHSHSVRKEEQGELSACTVPAASPECQILGGAGYLLAIYCCKFAHVKRFCGAIKRRARPTCR